MAGQPKADVVDVVVVVEVDTVVDGVKVAVNGVCSGVGNTTGMELTANVTVGVPSSTVEGPVAWMFWTAPAANTPSHTVLPVNTDWTWTQHGPVLVAVIWNEA
jgi:hypothetical protein